MKKIVLLATTILISMLLTACYTLDTFQKFPMNETKDIFNVIQEDDVAGFAKVIQKDLGIKFIVIGLNNAYLIENGSDKVNELLLMSSSNTKIEILTKSSEGLKLTIKPEQKEKNEFEGSLGFKFTINEPTQLQKDLLKEKTNSLKANLIEQEHESYLIVYISIKGKIVALNDELKARKLQNMSKNYHVMLGYYETKKSMKPSNLLFSVLMTPINLVADAIIMPLASIAVVTDSISP